VSIVPHQGFKLYFAYLVIAFDHLHGFRPTRRHYTEVVMPLQPPVANSQTQKL